ncbi:MAG: T9SS type A sorting domain-containing protein [Melioribacteraceae bacterium]|nr:T9SS type A sorting domain-containing protein [Melioribacteraceae bacterium]
MKKYFVNLLSVFFILGSLSAQNFVSRSVSNGTVEAVKSRGDLNILAVMVEFQEDRDSETYGTGKFGSHYSKDYGTSILDPLPHDQQYFEDHLLFAKNYFRKVSHGNLDIEYLVLPQIFTVSKTMRNYSPPNESENLAELGEFSKEVWELVAQSEQAPDFNDFDLFFIFHAGVSKGVITSGSLGLERDLPSIYLGLESFRNIFGSDFNGINTSKGVITNTAILPETDSREQQGFSDTVLIELTINGYICATIGSYIGIPDLYDTKTGKSSIGRFGLMDPQGFYAYNGVFPPEPSAWVKKYLGWITPQVITSDKEIFLIPYILNPSGNNSVVQIPINSKEYYLVERRSRDGNSDGSTITYKVNNEIKQITFQNDQDGFRYFNIDSLQGVVIDVDEFDWALPGVDEDDEDGEFEDIGLIIWHVDESVIEENLATNSINADRNRRGVFVIEADGIFDIGEDFVNILTGLTETREAIKEDTWYPNNPARLYENIFNFESNPPAVSNLGINSIVEMRNFNISDGVYTFNVSFGNEFVQRIGSIQLDNSLPYNWIVNSEVRDSSFYVGTPIKTFYVNLNFEIKQINAISNHQPALVNHRQTDYLILAEQNLLKIFSIDDFATPFKLEMNSEISAPITVVNFNSSAGTAELLVGMSSGELFKYRLTLTPQVNLTESSKLVISSGEAIKQISASPDGSSIVVITNSAIHNLSNSEVINKNNLNFITLTQNANVAYDYIALSDNGMFSFSQTELETSLPGINSIENIALSNIGNDGNNSVIFTNGSRLYALNASGTLNDNFPVEDDSRSGLSRYVLTADIDSDTHSDMLIFTDDGRMNIISGADGKVLSNYSISIGTAPAAAPVIFNRNGKIGLAVLDNSAVISVWEINADAEKIEWSGLYGNSLNQSSLKAASSSQRITQFFPETKAYNWPNPVYENETFIRFFILEESSVSVKIFDLAGELVEDIPAQIFPGGFDSEITWDVSNIQSGVYFAHIQANSTVSGSSASKVIKIAVIK